MALSNFSELVESLSAWLDGSDLGGREADLIALCEDEMNARLAVALREGAFIRPMAERGSLTITGEYVDLPDGNMVLPISIEVSGLAIPWEVRFLSAERMAGMKTDQEGERRRVEMLAGAAVPSFYTLIGGQLRFHPVPEQSFSAVFTRFSKVPQLSTDMTSNWVLASHRNAYLYGALAQAEFFGWNDVRMANVATLFAQAVDGIVARYPLPVDRARLTSALPHFGRQGCPGSLFSFTAGAL